MKVLLKKINTIEIVAIHSVVFADFVVKALVNGVLDGECDVLLNADVLR